MRAVKSQTTSSSSEELDKEREYVIGVIYGLGIALNEYFTVQNLCKEYDLLHSIPLVTKAKQLGYNSVDQLLMSSGYFQAAILKSQKHYRADPQRGSKATQDISSLIKRQTKKKKAKAPKVDTPTRQYFTRVNPRSHSFHGRPSAFGAGLIHNQKTILPRAPQRMLQHVSVEQCSSTTSSSVISNVPVPHKVPVQKLHYKFGKPPSTPQKLLNPAIGAERFVAALRKCGGSATEEQLEKAYRSLYQTDLNDRELSRCFNLLSIREIVNTYLQDLVEITFVRGHGTRRYKLRAESESPSISPLPTMCEFFNRLIEIMLDSEPNLVNLSAIAKLYEQKYDVEFTSEYRLIQEQVLTRSRKTIYIDSSGYLHLNHEDVDVKRMLTERLVQASLDAGIDSDPFESPTSSSSDRYMGNPEALAADSTYGDATVYVGNGDQIRRDIRRIKDEPHEQTFDRNLRFNRSYHGRTRIDKEDLRGAKLHEELSALRITIPGSSQSTSREVREERSSYPMENSTSAPGREKSSSLPERPPSSISTVSTSSGSHRRLGEKFASIGKFFQKEVIKEDSEGASSSASTVTPRSRAPANPPKNEKVSDKENTPVTREVDVECSHPYYNVHVMSSRGDARSLAAQKGLTIKR
ncbi:unnamed protein product [Cylicocyclus nassatus]|uniref:Uncharacterized protein n=1 Tax=Cylicocyclus nassatus TaxID=53992 RepID=A0AA36GS18_CYLNA|nr:unnamed protein product [Cylicocyclus nassatus]